jgi:PAS domain S-box-containing protein
MLDRLTDGIVVLGPDWRFRYVNDRGAALLGRRSGELVGREAWSEFPEAVGRPTQVAFLRAARDREAVRLVDHYEPHDRWFEISVFPQEIDVVVVFRDVTALHRSEQERREYADRMAEAERIACFGVWEWEIATGRVQWSDELHRIYGLEPGEFGGTAEAFTERLHPDDRERIWANVTRAMETGEPFAFEERILRADGQERVLLSQGRVIGGPDGSPAALVGVCHDVTDRAQAERALGISEQRMRAIIDNTPSIVAVKDLDGRYLMSNAETGRVLGVEPDALIGQQCESLFPAELADRFRDNDRRAAAEGEAVYDEAILMRDGEPRTYLTVTFPLPDEHGMPVETCTIGTDVTERWEREGERQVRHAWSRRIGDALAHDGMVVFAQPVIDIRSGRTASYELLIRMLEDGARELVPPRGFLPAAERYGLVQSIDLWMIEQAIAVAGRLAPEVNLSAVTLSDDAAMRRVVGLLAAAPDAAARIVFEITETAAARHLVAARAFAEEITALGCGLALDDFGTGFGSFTYLRELPLRYLKIDRSFVTGLVGSASDRRVVQSIIGIAEQFDLQTIAEGVEDAPTLELLREMGTDLVQGFHLGRPAPLEQAPPAGVRPLRTGAGRG